MADNHTVWKHARGTSDALDAYAGPVGEVVVDTTTSTLRVQNGTTGGMILARKPDLDAVASQVTTLAGTTATGSTNGLMSSVDKAKLDGVAVQATRTAVTATYSTGTSLATISINGEPTVINAPAATSSQLGLVRTGTGLTTSNGTLAVDDSHIQDLIDASSSGGTTYTAGDGITISSANAISLSTSGVTANTYGPTADVTPAHGATFTVPKLTVDAYGRITGASNQTITLPADSNTDTLMTQNVSTSNATYPILLCPTANATANQGAKTGIFASSVKVNPSTGTISATTFVGSFTGNADTATTAVKQASIIYTDGNYSDVVNVTDGTNRVGTIRVTNGDGYNQMLLGVHNESNGAPVGLTIRNADGTVSANLDGTFTASTFVGSLTGNADTATTASSATEFSAAKSVTLTGDVTGTASSKAGWSVATTLANSGVTAGNYGPTADATPSHGATFSVPYITVDAKGRVIGAATRSIKLPADNNTTYTAGTGITISSANAIGLAVLHSSNASYGPTADVDLENGGSFTVPYVTRDTYGRVTGASNKTIKLPTISAGSNYTAGSGITISSNTISLESLTSANASYGPSADATPAHGATFSVPYITVDKYGRVTGAATRSIKLPADNNTDTLMTQNVSTDNATHPVLLCPTANATTNQGAKTGIFTSGVRVNPSTGVLVADGGLYVTGDITIAKRAPRCIFKDTRGVKGTAPSSNLWNQFFFVRDNNDIAYGGLEHGFKTTLENRMNMIVYKGTTNTTSENAQIAVGFDSNGNWFTYAPTPAVTDNSTKMATTAWVRTATGNFAANAASASKLGTSTVGSVSQPIYLNAGTPVVVSSALKTCYAVVESEAVTNNIFKIASGAMGGTYNYLNIVILVQQLMGPGTGIWRISLNVGATAGVFAAGVSSLVDNVGLDPSKFIVAYKSNSGGNLQYELYAKVDARYSGYRFTVLQEASRNGQVVGNHLTLTNHLTTTGTSAITSGFTALTTINATVIGPLSGNASSATEFSAAKSVTLTGDVTGTASSKAGWSIATTLANSGVTAASYGLSDNASPAHGGSFKVPYITVDAKGRITQAAAYTVTLPADSNTDTKVTQSASTASGSFPLLVKGTAGTSGTYTGSALYSAKIYADVSGGYLYTTTPATSTNNTTVATTEFVRNAITTYATDTNTDVNVTQSSSTTNGKLPVLLKSSTATSNVTTTVSFGTKITANPSTGYLFTTTPATTTNDTTVATTQFVRNAISTYATDTNTTYSAGDGMTLSGTSFAVNSTVVRTSGAQTVAGVKTYSDNCIHTGGNFIINRSGSAGGYGVWNGSFSTSNAYTNKRGGMAVRAISGSVQRVDIECYKANNSATNDANMTYFSLFDEDTTIEAVIGSKRTSGVTYYYFKPDNDKVWYLGRKDKYWKEIYCASATINTSDKREKGNIQEIDPAVLDVWDKVNLVQFQWNRSIAKHGDAARIHTGAIAQDIRDVFEEAGLDVSRYDFWCYDKWDAEEPVYAADGTETKAGVEAGDAYALSYGQFSIIEAAYMRRRVSQLEAKVAELSAKLETLLPQNG